MTYLIEIWESVSVFNEKFNSGNAVAVSGFVDSYLDRQYLNIKKINKATIQYYGRYGFDPADIVPSSNSSFVNDDKDADRGDGM